MKISLWINESPNGSNREKLIKIFERYEELCGILEIGFYEHNLKDIKWAQITDESLTPLEN